MSGTTPKVWRTSISNALTWVLGEEAPHRLKQLARVAILRCVAGSDLPSASSLGIPEVLVQYLLYN